LGALRETLIQKRALQGFLVNTFAENGPEGFQATEQLVRLAWRVRLLTTAAEWFDWLLSQEANFHALRRHQPLAGLPAYRAVRSNDILDNKLALGPGAIGALDMGELTNVDFPARAGRGLPRWHGRK
jgi:hypothetical protein